MRALRKGQARAFALQGGIIGTTTNNTGTSLTGTTVLLDAATLMATFRDFRGR